MVCTRTGIFVFSSLLVQRNYYFPELINVGISSKENRRIFCVLRTSKINHFLMGFMICRYVRRSSRQQQAVESTMKEYGQGQALGYRGNCQ
jgi:hypothetical protein